VHQARGGYLQFPLSSHEHYSQKIPPENQHFCILPKSILQKCHKIAFFNLLQIRLEFNVDGLEKSQKTRSMKRFP